MRIALLLLIVLAGRSLAGSAANEPPVSSATQPAQNDDSVDAAFERELAEIDAKARTIADLKADYVQLKHTALLKKPMRSEGTVMIRIDDEDAIIRWDATRPHPVTTWIGEDEMRIYSPRESLLEVYPIEKGWSQLAASPLPRLESLREQFTISRWTPSKNDVAKDENLIGLKLVPSQDQISEHVREVRILINRESACVVRAEVLYPDDDRLELRFHDIRTNSGVSEREMELKVPADTTISRPLESKERSH